jgi:hypothetical protein
VSRTKDVSTNFAGTSLRGTVPVAVFVFVVEALHPIRMIVVTRQAQQMVFKSCKRVFIRGIKRSKIAM